MNELFAIGSTEAESSHTYIAVFLHGYGSDERDLVSLSAYLPEGLTWASVRAPRRHPNIGYSWYQLETDSQPATQIADATAALWNWIDESLPAGALVVPIGFSQGSMMASQLLRTRPERIGATVALSGYVSTAPQPADAALTQSRPPLFWGRADYDPVVPPFEVEAAGRWYEQHTTCDSHLYPGLGHSVSEQELADMRAFLERVLV